MGNVFNAGLPNQPGGNSVAASAPSLWPTNPKHLPILAAHTNAIFLKTLITTTSSPSTAAFFTAIALDGAEAAITGADAYATICDQTGGGFFFNAVLPTHSAAYRPTAKFTIDGVVYIITPTADQTALWRVIIGATIGGYDVSAIATAATAGMNVMPNQATDPGFKNARIGGIRQYGTGTALDELSIPTETAIMGWSLPMLRFESAFKLEVKCNLLSATAVDKQCAASFRMDL